MVVERRRRRAARVILLDPDGRVLLLRGSDPGRPEAGTWWLTPGGGIEDDEDEAAAAVRELAEETGLVLASGRLGQPVLIEESSFDFDGVAYAQTNVFFRVQVEPFTLDTSGWTPVEVASMSGHRWWSAEELRATTETFFPATLPDLLGPH